MFAETFAVLLRGALFFASFCGLSAAAREALKLNRFVAPFFSASCAICALMFGGMLRALPVAFGLLYFGGFAGLIYVHFIRRVRPDFALIGLMAAFAAVLVWRFWGTALFRNDDVSHWGLVARYLLEYDAFPDRSTELVFFQSYPLGSASFLYYVCRAVANREGLYFAAQGFLMGLAFLPLLAHIRQNRGFLAPVAAGLFVYLFKYNHELATLQVDWLLAFLAIGAAASAAACGRGLREMLTAALPACIAMVYVKNSGLFFAVATLLIVYLRAGDRRRARRAVPAGAAGVAAAYLAWILHVRLSYDSGLSTKHAVSLTAYAQEASQKGLAFIARLAGEMLEALVRPEAYQLVSAAFVALCFAAVAAVCRLRPEFRPARAAVYRRLGGAVGAYAAWYAMLYAMYVFSMPAEEASWLASYFRYNATGLMYMMGLSALAMFDFFSQAKLRAGWWARIAYPALIAGCAAVLALCAPSSFLTQLFVRESGLIPIRQRIVDAREAFDLPDGGRYMTFTADGAEGRRPRGTFYYVKYDLQTADQLAIVAGEQPSGEPFYAWGDPDEGGTFGDDPTAFIRENIDDCDALILLDEHSQFEAIAEEFAASYEGDTPVIFTCR